MDAYLCLLHLTAGILVGKFILNYDFQLLFVTCALYTFQTCSYYVCEIPHQLERGMKHSL